jgi:putative ubiquitin-RnfH superfamily antitoxin RatB of RatAB toxin-antitoxin module
MKSEIQIEVAFATPEKQLIIPVFVKEGTTAIEAVKLSKIEEQFTEIDLKNLVLGIFGKHITPETVLREKDRVEIYRPLIADPKEIRRKRAEEGKAMKKGGGELENNS